MLHGGEGTMGSCGWQRRRRLEADSGTGTPTAPSNRRSSEYTAHAGREHGFPIAAVAGSNPAGRTTIFGLLASQS